MFKREYLISGITPKLLEQWYGGLREDFKLFVNKEREILGKIKLSKNEAKMAEAQLNEYNQKHNCVLKINKMEEKYRRV